MMNKKLCTVSRHTCYFCLIHANKWCVNIYIACCHNVVKTHKTEKKKQWTWWIQVQICKLSIITDGNSLSRSTSTVRMYCLFKSKLYLNVYFLFPPPPDKIIAIRINMLTVSKYIPIHLKLQRVRHYFKY